MTRPRPIVRLLWASAAASTVALGAAGPDAFNQEGQGRRTPRAPVWRHEVVRAYPHDPEAFTQGLVFRDGALYESTGLNGKSSLRRVALDTGRVLQRTSVDRRYFAEGLAAWGPNLVQLTWDTNVGFVYDRASFRLLRTFTYGGEGWGLADDGRQLILSDGTPALRFLDPTSFAETRRVTVRDGGTPVDDLNELEVVDGLVYANVWLTDRIAVITPADGRVVAWLELKGLAPAVSSADAVLNGIAYDAAAGRLFVTGKLWPRLFEIRVRRP
ncbi:MAG TPA: glutaminyl-peptide cyclotransferase [Vicinamibacterales bacterium]